MFYLIATMNCHVDITKYLVEKDVNVEPRDFEGFSAVHWGFLN